MVFFLAEDKVGFATAKVLAGTACKEQCACHAGCATYDKRTAIVAFMAIFWADLAEFGKVLFELFGKFFEHVYWFF